MYMWICPEEHGGWPIRRGSDGTQAEALGRHLQHRQRPGPRRRPGRRPVTEPLLHADEFDGRGIDPASLGEHDDPHADCLQPHRGPDGDLYDCDGQPL